MAIINVPRSNGFTLWDALGLALGPIGGAVAGPVGQQIGTALGGAMTGGARGAAASVIPGVMNRALGNTAGTGVQADPVKPPTPMPGYQSQDDLYDLINRQKMLWRG